MKTQQILKAKLNKRERRVAALLAHYATCERLAAYLSRTVWTPPRLPGIVAALARGARFASDEDCQPEKGSE